MKNDDSANLRLLLERVRQGDERAREELIGHSYERLRSLARRIFHKEFPRLEGVHETGSVLHEAALRLLRALRTARPTTLRAYFAFASVQIRRVLIGMTRRLDRRGDRHELEPLVESGARHGQECAELIDPTSNGVDLAIWTEFHESVDRLPEEEREVVDLYLYQDFTQAEIAQLLGVHKRAVSRIWQRALLKLSDDLPGWEDGVQKE